MNLTKASSQWANRPEDERFWTLEEMLAVVSGYRQNARETDTPLTSLRAEASDNELYLVGQKNIPAKMTSWAFSQLAQDVHAPASYLQALPATLAAQNINHGLKNFNGPSDARLLLDLDVTGKVRSTVRAITTEKYSRIWNQDIVKKLQEARDWGWVVPPAYAKDGRFNVMPSNTRIATADDAAVSLTIREGDTIGPAGLYAGVEDMFAFMVHPGRIVVDGSKGGLMRGFFVWNSEVGKSSFGFMTFLFRGVCGNHIVWDAQSVREVRIRHIGKNIGERAFGSLLGTVIEYADSSVTEDEAKIKRAQEFSLGSDGKAVVEAIFDKGILSRKIAQAAYEAVVVEEDGDPNTAWGYAQGVTRLSQGHVNADARVALDRAASEVVKMAF